MNRIPLTLWLPHSLTTRGFDLARVIAEDRSHRSRDAYRLREYFALGGPEQRFAIAMLRRHTAHWLFRCNQRAFCGDFIVVTMSAREPEERIAYVIELKQGARLRRALPRRVQLANAGVALAEIRLGRAIIGSSTPTVLLVGDPTAVGAFFAGGGSARE